MSSTSAEPAKNQIPPTNDTNLSRTDTSNNLDLEKRNDDTVILGEDNPDDELTEKQRDKKDPNVIDWDGPDDPEFPRNWSSKKRWSSMAVVALMCFVSPFASTLPAPALPELAAKFGITNSSIAALTISVSYHYISYICETHRL